MKVFEISNILKYIYTLKCRNVSNERLHLFTLPSGNFLSDKIFLVDNIFKQERLKEGKHDLLESLFLRRALETSNFIAAAIPARHFSLAPETRNSFATRRLYITTVAFIDSFQRHPAFPPKEIKLPWSQRLLPIPSIYEIFTKTSKSRITCPASANENS